MVEFVVLDGSGSVMSMKLARNKAVITANMDKVLSKNKLTQDTYNGAVLNELEAHLHQFSKEIYSHLTQERANG